MPEMCIGQKESIVVIDGENGIVDESAGAGRAGCAPASQLKRTGGNGGGADVGVVGG